MTALNFSIATITTNQKVTGIDDVCMVTGIDDVCMVTGIDDVCM